MLAVSTTRPFSNEMEPMPDVPICCWNFCHNVDPSRMPIRKEDQRARASRAAMRLFEGVASTKAVLPSSERGIAQ